MSKRTTCDRCGMMVSLKGLTQHRQHNQICNALKKAISDRLKREMEQYEQGQHEEGSDDDYWQG